MKNKQIVSAIVGIVIGFILGFFVSQVFVHNPSRLKEQASATAPRASSELPEGHPTPEMIEKLGELQAWVEAHPQDSEARISLANFYYDMGRYDAAIQWYEEVLKLQPSTVNVRTDLATAYLYTGNPIKAVELYKQSLEIEPDHAQTLQNIGVAYFSTGNFSEAIENWEKLLEAHPNYPHREEIKKQIENARAQIQGDRS